MSTDQRAATTSSHNTLRNLYFIRLGFALIWAVLLTVLPTDGPPLLTILVVLYPLADAAAVAFQLRRLPATPATRLSQLGNIVGSVVAAAALGWASLVPNPIPWVLGVWGVWAAVAGLTQLLTSVNRRSLGGQWPQIFSGGLSVIVGTTFVISGLQRGDSLTGIAAYAVVGGVFFLASGLRLSRSLEKPST